MTAVEDPFLVNGIAVACLFGDNVFCQRISLCRDYVECFYTYVDINFALPFPSYSVVRTWCSRYFHLLLPVSFSHSVVLFVLSD